MSKIMKEWIVWLAATGVALAVFPWLIKVFSFYFDYAVWALKL